MVVLDPGHGGKDAGAMGPGGLREADVTLAVALSVRELLRMPQLDVRLTRETDRYVGLGVRAEMANNAQGRLFLSIHCNSAANPRAAGIETWHFRGSRLGRQLAAEVQRQMTAEFPRRKDRGVKAGGFLVLRETAMPAALAELEFIHSAEGEAHLGDPNVQARYADALAAAVLEVMGFEMVGGVGGEIRFAAAKADPRPRLTSALKTFYRAFGPDEQ